MIFSVESTGWRWRRCPPCCCSLCSFHKMIGQRTKCTWIWTQSKTYMKITKDQLQLMKVNWYWKYIIRQLTRAYSLISSQPVMFTKLWNPVSQGHEKEPAIKEDETSSKSLRKAEEDWRRLTKTEEYRRRLTKTDEDWRRLAKNDEDWRRLT